MASDPVRSPVDGTLREALEVALAHQRRAAVEHETWPVGVAWGDGEAAGFVQWGHDEPGEQAPDGWLGLLEAGVDHGAAARVAPALVGLGFGPETQAFGPTRVFTWEADDDDRSVGDDEALIGLLTSTALACGAPDRASYAVYPDP